MLINSPDCSTCKFSWYCYSGPHTVLFSVRRDGKVSKLEAIFRPSAMDTKDEIKTE